MKKLIITIAIIFVNFAHAKTLIISDIDDTLKATYVRSFWGKIKTRNHTNSFFKSMPELFEAILDEDAENKIFYVSNAPGWLIGDAHDELIQRNDFPQGPVLLRKGSSETFKMRAFRKIIKTEAPDTVLLFGDNAENDPKFFNAIENEFKNVNFVSAVHMMYDTNVFAANNNKLFDDQIAYASAFDLIIHIFESGILSEKALVQFYQQESQKFMDALPFPEDDLEDEAYYFPPYMDCLLIDWEWQPEYSQLSGYDKIYKETHSRCSSF